MVHVCMHEYVQTYCYMGGYGNVFAWVCRCEDMCTCLGESFVCAERQHSVNIWRVNKLSHLFNSVNIYGIV